MTAYSQGATSGSGPGDAALSSIALRRAEAADLPIVRALLTAAALPLDGVDEAFVHGVVAIVGDTVVGAAAIERYGADGLLRSVVVDPGSRGAGVGCALVAAAEALAGELGVLDLWLLTETAIGWFPRLGYEIMDRTAAPATVAGSVEFTVACKDTGVLMHRRLPVAG